VVTGGAGVLGRAVVARLLAEGARVAVPYRAAADFAALRDAVGGSAALFGREADVASAEAMRAFVAEAAAFLGTLDGVAGIAGAFAMGGFLEEAPAGEWDAMLSANLATAYATSRAALPHLLRQGGSMVFVGSRMAETGGAKAAAYAVSKSALLALVRVLALENRDRKVRVNAVLPGVIDTPANRDAMPKADHGAWTSPEAIARVVAFLLSKDSGPTTGAFVPVDLGGV
jgi:NAD(P)-dependent dehydrogenase (short-subunit alcohol dehydrogenase family)